MKEKIDVHSKWFYLTIIITIITIAMTTVMLVCSCNNVSTVKCGTEKTVKVDKNGGKKVVEKTGCEA